MFERNQEMTKRFIVAGLLIGTALFALSGCDTQENEGVIETQVAREAQEVNKTEEVEAAKTVEEAKEAQEVESTKLALRINCGATQIHRSQRQIYRPAALCRNLRRHNDRRRTDFLCDH
jgi:uncharacterized protein YgiB involved in biofilm formation